MLQTIDAPRDQVAASAPKIHVMTIKPDQIRDVIGKGGETIDKIIEKSNGIKIDIEKDGTIFLTGENQSDVDQAITMIKELTFEMERGTTYDASVTRVENYGAFISVKGKSGLVHVSNMGGGISDATARFKVGDTMQVQRVSTDDKGRMAFKRVVQTAKTTTDSSSASA
jgi:polyribonucleotide nucleotidyltransferase